MLLDQNCLVCNKKSEDYKSLLNGTRVHPACYEKLSEVCISTRNQISRINSEKWTLKNELNEATSILGKFKNIFSGTKVNIPQTEGTLTLLDIELLELNEVFEVHQQKLHDIHSFWPTYPPDWEDRKRIIHERSYNSCESCGSEHGEKHVHHKKPISKGGSHLLENLEYICVNCHSDAHGGRDMSTEDLVVSEDTKSSFQNKVDLIQNTIDSKRIINFSYQKYDGDQSVRAISPTGLEQVGKSLCVYGYCYLRGETRTFAIKRMKSLKSADSPGNCYEK